MYNRIKKKTTSFLPEIGQGCSSGSACSFYKAKSSTHPNRYRNNKNYSQAIRQISEMETYESRSPSLDRENGILRKSPKQSTSTCRG